MMQAFRFDGENAGFRTLPIPSPGPNGLVLKVLAAGLCHSDISVMNRSKQEISFPLPVTLGHEVVGEIVATNCVSSERRVGEVCIVHGPRGCGKCLACVRGNENYCAISRSSGIWPYGLGRDGGLAEFIAIDDANDLVPLGTISPEQGAVLADAGLTAYHAVVQEIATLTDEDWVLLIGIGGVGHMALQILTALSPAKIIAIDRNANNLELAQDLGAREVMTSTTATVESVRALTGLAGASVVWDMVGSQETIDLAHGVVSVGGKIVLVGVGIGQLPVSVARGPLGLTVRTTYWGSKSELVALLDLVKLGKVSAHVNPIKFADVPTGYQDLRNGLVRGRIVVTFD